MIMAAVAIFQALILMEVSIGECQTSVQIRQMVRLLEFYCELPPIRRNFKNVICVTPIFFAFTVYFVTNPVSESLQHSLKLRSSC